MLAPMNIIMVDANTSFLNKIRTALGNTVKFNENLNFQIQASEEIDYFLDTPHDIAQSIAYSLEKEESTIIFINIEGRYNGSKFHDLKGVEVLKWLRLKGVTNHCILYSFLSIEKIVKMNPLNSILLSKGVTFIRSPFTLPDLSRKLFEEKSDKKSLLPFFRAEIDVKEIRHELANEWGLIRLKWALDENVNSSTSNYLISVLRFLQKDSKKTRSNKRDILEKQITWFNTKNPHIFYYDDMAEEWGPVLKQMLGANFKSFNPREINGKTFINEEILNEENIKNIKCLLLDLRLHNEKDIKANPLDYSGGILLNQMKKQLFSLPVIMITATNKAESVRKLLSAGAEYVWTKEGVDDGINDTYTIENTIDLMTKIRDCVFKFEDETSKQIFEAEAKITKKYKIDRNIQYKLSAGKLKTFNSIIFDTSFFLDTKNPGEALPLFNNILIANKNLGNNSKHFIIHDDVYREIFIMSKKNIKDKSPLAKFLLKLLYDWNKKGYVKLQYEYGHSSIINELAKINKDLSPLEKKNFEENSFFEKITELFDNNQNNKIQLLNEQITKLKKQFSILNKLEKIRLHADDTFVEIIPSQMAKGSVMFVSADHTCAYRVGECFRSNGSDINERQYNCKFDNAGTISTMNGVKKVKIGNYHYQHCFVREFFGMFKP